MLALLLNAGLIGAIITFLLGIILSDRGRELLRDAGEVATVDLAQLTERAAELRDACLASVTRVGELRTVPKDKQGDTFAADVRSAIDDLHANDAMHQAVTRILKDAADAERAAKEAEERAKNGGRGPAAATGAHTGDGTDLRSLGQQVIDDESYQEFAARGARGGEVGVEVRTLLDTAVTSPAAGLFMPRGTPFLNPNALDRRRLFVRDLLSTGTTGLNSVPYIRELSPRTNETGATTVAEGGDKPEVTMQFVAADAPVRKIAAWIPVTSEILADAPTLRSYIDARLEYMLAIREEDQVLNGDGVAPNLEGIREATGLQTSTGPAGDNLTAIADAIVKIELVDGEADGVALNPTDFWDMLTRRAAGDDHYDVDPFMDPARMAPWGLPPVRTRSLAAGTAVVGAWRIGGQLLDREQTVVRVGDQHSDYFTKNKAAILAEKRVAFLNHRPDYFVEVTFTPAA